MSSWPDMPAGSADRGKRSVTISQGKGVFAGGSRVWTESAGPERPAPPRAMTATQVPAMDERTDGEAIRHGCDQPPELLRPRGRLASGERREQRAHTGPDHEGPGHEGSSHESPGHSGPDHQDCL